MLQKIVALENNISVDISNIMGDRYVLSDENKKIFYIDANKLYGWALTESVPYDDIKFDRNVELEDNLSTPGNGNIG